MYIDVNLDVIVDDFGVLVLICGQYDVSIVVCVGVVDCVVLVFRLM